MSTSNFVRRSAVLAVRALRTPSLQSLTFPIQSITSTSRTPHLLIRGQVTWTCESFPEIVTRGRPVTMASKEDLNMFYMIWAFANVLLPPIKILVRKGLKEYLHKVRKEFLDNKKSKINEREKTFFETHRNSSKNDLDEFAKLYVGNVYRNKGTKLKQSGDWRMFLDILSSAGCFNELSKTAKRLKSSADKFAHGESPDIQSVLTDIEEMLEKIPESENYLRMLKQFKEKGPAIVINSMTEEQLTSLQESLEEGDLPSNLKTSIGTLIASTINSLSENNKSIQEHITKDSKVKWSARPVLCEKLMVTGMKCVNKNGGEINLQTITNSGKLKFKRETDIGGHNFKIAKTAFAKGSTRLAYRGHFDLSLNPQNYHKFCDTPEVVLKKTVASVETELFLKIKAVAEVFAKEWNQQTVEKKYNIRFLDLYMANVKLEKEDIDVTIEEYINKTKYTKWSNNDGFVNTEQYEPELDAFSHWTHEVTRGQMIVVDLQGERRGNTFLLTDPAIHCAVGEYGVSNRRTRGIHQYFETHVCNSVCKALCLTPQVY